MKKQLSVLILCFIFQSVFSLEWPSENIDFLLLFGQETGKDFSQGVVFKDTQTVKASEHGKLLIAIEKKDNIGRFPSALGNALIFIHEDGLQTVYGNLEDTQLFKTREETDANSIIGTTGQSGWSEPKSLIFQVADIKNKVFLNPLLLMPYLEDKILPQIQNVILTDRKNNTVNLNEIKMIKQGSYDLYASISDKITKESKDFSPFRVTVFLNGTNVSIIPFEVLTSDQSKFYLKGSKIHETLLYGKKGYLYLGKIDFTRGKTNLTISARDITGNEKIETFSIQVE